MSETTTNSAKYVGDCWKCGWQCYEHVHHECPTVPRYTGTHTYGSPWTIKTQTNG